MNGAMRSCVHALCRNTFTAFTFDEGLAAVPTGSQRPFDGDVPVQAFLAEGAAASGIVGTPCL